MLLSNETNPYYYIGTYQGLGSPHNKGDKMVWHLGLIMQIMTSNNDKEILQCLDTLKNTTANTGFMHEAFYADDPTNYVRPWFSWANSFYGEMIMDLLGRKPYLLMNI